MSKRARRTRLAWFLLGIGALLTPLQPAFADDAESSEIAAPVLDPAAMEALWAEIRTPGENHRFLARLAGDWIFESTMWMMDPSAPPMESLGAASKTMIMGGRYLQEELDGEAMGEPFHGRAVTGFDNVSGDFVATWIDDMATGILVSRGSRDGDTLTLTAEMIDPMSEQPMKLRMVTRIVDEDHHVFDYYVTMPGMAEARQMVLKYSRKSGD